MRGWWQCMERTACRITKLFRKLFKWDRQSIQDDLKCGRPVEAQTEETIKRFEDFLLADRRYC